MTIKVDVTKNCVDYYILLTMWNENIKHTERKKKNNKYRKQVNK